MTADGSAAAPGEGGSARVLRAGGGASARRARAGRLAAQDGVDPAVDADHASYDAAADAGEDDDAVGGGGADGDRNWDSLSALRVAGGGAAGVGVDATAAVATASKTGASRVPRGSNAAAAGASETARVFGGGGGGSSSEPAHQRAPATRVVARRPSVLTTASAPGGGADKQSLGGAVASKVGRGAQPTRVIGRQHQQHQQQQRLDGGMTGRQGEEAGDRRAEGVPLRAAVNASVSVVLDRRDVLRQVRVHTMA